MDVHPEGYGRYESQPARKERSAYEAMCKVRESQPTDASMKDVIARYGRQGPASLVAVRRIADLP
jgi:hypothetical protein